MPKTTCPLCQSTDLKTVVMDAGPHHAKSVCRQFGHFVEWLPRPVPAASEMPPELAPLVVRRDKPVSLRGTPSQVAAARSLRANMIGFASRAGATDYVRLLACVEDAGWFFANRGKFPPDLKCWPRADQMAAVEEGAKR